MNCDPIARWYRWFEYLGFGRALERRREAFLNCTTGARRVLVLGDGDGRALVALLRANSQATVDYVDVSARMLALARARAGDGRVRYHHADALTMPLGDAAQDLAYDLIVTHFFLDCFDAADQARLIERVALSASPDAVWMVSEFRKPGILVGFLYLFFRVTTGLQTRRLADHRPSLERQGFRLARVETALFGRLASELWTRAQYNKSFHSKETDHENAGTYYPSARTL